MFHLTRFSKNNYCCSMFLTQSKLSFSFVSVLPKRNCFEMLNQAYIFTSGALPPRKKSWWKNEEISPYLRCPGPIQTKTFHLEKTHDERIERTTQKWSAQATHRQTSMIWNSVAARKELQQKWCYSLLWRDNVENVVTRCCNFS